MLTVGKDGIKRDDFLNSKIFAIVACFFKVVVLLGFTESSASTFINTIA